MSCTLQKQRRMRLEQDDYEKLRQEILLRDGWRCQSCGAMSGLEVHHQQFRSRQGSDCAENLITLCTECHEFVHNETRS